MFKTERKFFGLDYLNYIIYRIATFSSKLLNPDELIWHKLLSKMSRSDNTLDPARGFEYWLWERILILSDKLKHLPYREG